MIYTELINDFYIAESTKDKWEILLAEPINMVQFHRHFKNIYIVTNISKLRSFQYLLLHWAVITSKMLHKWKVIESPLCSFCNQVPEDIVHLLYSCSIIKEFWRKAVNLYNEIIDFYVTPTELNVKQVMFNMGHNKANHIVNFFVLMTKYYISVADPGFPVGGGVDSRSGYVS